MDAQQLRRSFESVAFTTTIPFTDDLGAVDHDALAENLARLYDAGARLFVPCGNTGEYYSLTDEERIAVVETHVQATGTDATIAAGAAGSIPEVQHLTSSYAEVGADAVMIMHPHHTFTHEEGLKTYYRRICDATDLGVVVYKGEPDLTRNVLVDLTEYEEIVAIKFATKDIREFAQTVEDADGTVTWVNGIAERYALSFSIEGASGYTTGVGNFVPRATLALFDAIRSGQWDRARTIQRSLRPMEDMRDEPGKGSDLEGGNNVPVIKYGMDLAGYNGGPVRQPIVDLAEPDRDRLERYYRPIKETLDKPT